MHALLCPSTPNPVYPPPSSSLVIDPLLGSALHNGGRALLALDRAAAGTARLDALDHADTLGVVVGHGAEDDVAAVQPAGHDGRDEELAAVGVGAGVRHGEHEGLVVGELEVLIGELLAVDGLAASALFVQSSSVLRSRAGLESSLVVRYRG